MESIMEAELMLFVCLSTCIHVPLNRVCVCSVGGAKKCRILNFSSST